MAGAQESGDFVLHVFHFVQAQLRILHDKNIAGRAVLVDQDATVRYSLLGFDLL